MSDAESGACETQVWLAFGRRCGYLKDQTSHDLDCARLSGSAYDQIIGQIVNMMRESDKWLIKYRFSGSPPLMRPNGAITL